MNCRFSHYLLFLGLFVAFTYNKKQPPAFGAALAFWCILLSFLGLLFCHISNNLSNYNVLTANAPFFYQISGTWSNHEGSILLWCWILSFYGFLLCYRGGYRSHLLSREVYLYLIRAKKGITKYFEQFEHPFCRVVWGAVDSGLWGLFWDIRISMLHPVKSL